MDAPEHRDEVLHGQVASAGLVGAGVEGVEARWPGAAVGVEQDDAVGGAAREPGEDVGDEVAFGVDEHDPAACVGVGEHHVREQGRFAGAGGADDVQVVAGVAHAQRHRPRVAGVGVAQGFGVRAVLGDGGWRWHGAGTGPVEPGDVVVEW